MRPSDAGRKPGAGARQSVEGTGKKDDPGLLRFDFGPTDESLDPISWDDFFAKFDSANLAFLYQDKTADGIGKQVPQIRRSR